MKESYSEGLASHTGPESCAFSGNTLCEALTGVRAGRVLSFENCQLVSGADVFCLNGRQHFESRDGETFRGPAESEALCMHGNIFSENRDTLCLSQFAHETAWRTHIGARP
jgi:hypothetical protein